jgi:hypothetical protein
VDRRNALILLSLVAVAAVIGSTALTVYAADNGEGSSNGFAGWFNRKVGLNEGGTCGWGRGWRSGWGLYGSIVVSAEYNQTVINIAKSDPDVQNLLAEGYSIFAVRPIIQSVVQADGSVVIKTTSAVVILVNGTTGRAEVYVDVTNGKVTKIVILTMTVIEKS